MSQTTANLLYELIEVKQEMKNSIERKGSIVEGGLVVYPEAIDNISQGITEEEKQQYIDQIERLEEQKSQLESTVDELESEKTELTNQVNTLTEEKNNLSSQLSDANANVSRLESEIEVLENNIAIKNQEISELNAQISTLENDINELQSRIESYYVDLTQYGYTEEDSQRYNIDAQNSIKLPIEDAGDKYMGVFDWNDLNQYDYYGEKLKHLPWYGKTDMVIAPQIINFDTTGASENDLFYEQHNLRTIPMFDMSNVNTMTRMFSNCYCLTSIPLLDTSNVTNFQECFSNCRCLTSIPQLDTSNVTTFLAAFGYCSSLTSIPLLDTHNAYSMGYMFDGCSLLKSIPLLDTSNAVEISNMFGECISLTSIPLLDTSKVTQASYMFTDCISLKNIPSLDLHNVNNIEGMFYNCKSLVKIPNLDLSSITSFGYNKYSDSSGNSHYSGKSWVYGCDNLKEIGVLKCENVTDCAGMWCGVEGSVDYYLTSFINPNILYIGGLEGLGKQETVTRFYNIIYEVPNIGRDSIVNIFNTIYDRATAGLNDQLLYITQKQIDLLTEDDIAIATDKGYYLSTRS